MANPAQALSYKIGQLKIIELRKRATAELGEQFDNRKFHEIVLEAGCVPLTLLEDKINAWITNTKAAIMSGLNSDIFTFFKELKENNNRWFAPQKKRFKALEAEVKDFGARVQHTWVLPNTLIAINCFEFIAMCVFQKIKPL